MTSCCRFVIKNDNSISLSPKCHELSINKPGHITYFGGSCASREFKWLDYLYENGVKIINQGPNAAFRLYYGNMTDKYFYIFTNMIPHDDSVYWDRYDYFYVNIPKTGTTSLSSVLDAKRLFGHMYARNYPQKIQHKLKTMVRNPYDRIVSCYFFMVDGGFGTPQYKEITAKYKSFDDFVLNFLDTVHTILDRKYMYLELLVKQTEYLVDDNGEICVHHENIGRFEDYESEIYRLYGTNIVSKLAKSNHDQWKSYYSNQKVIDKVYNLYEDDFIKFNYPKSII